MAYVVFGGSGFLGRYLVDELSKRDSVIIGDLLKPQCKHGDNVTYVKMDVRNPETFDNIVLSYN